jgi:hypothetical protein
MRLAPIKRSERPSSETPTGIERPIMWKLWVSDTVHVAMPRPRIDISQGLDGEFVVLACFDFGEEQIAASSHAVAATAERFRAASRGRLCNRAKAADRVSGSSSSVPCPGGIAGRRRPAPALHGIR